jgi:hypothetical protein
MLDSLKVCCRVVMLAVFAILMHASLDVFGQRANAPQNANPSFALSVAPVTPVVKAGSNVFVNVTMENISDHDFSTVIVLGRTGIDYPTDVWNEKGAMATETRYGLMRNGHRPAVDPGPTGGETLSGINRTLDRGKSFTDRVNVSDLYDFSHPGKYTIQVKQYDVESKSIVTSNKITMTVTP